MPYIPNHHQMMGQVGKYISVKYLLQAEQRKITTAHQGYLNGHQSEESTI